MLAPHPEPQGLGPDGLEVLAFGPLGDGDAEMVEGLWEDPEG